MPELPEVETVRRGLEKRLVGHEVLNVEVLREKSYPVSESDSDTFVIGSKILNVRRRAKILFIDLSTGYTLLIHLKMTGQLVYRSNQGSFGAGHPNNSLVHHLPDRSTRVIIELDDARLFFNDQRVFGWIKLAPTAEVTDLEMVKKLGPEPLEKTFTDKVFLTQIARRKRSRIKPALLDQSVVAGIGNIYADEALWAAKIHPETIVESISQQQLKQLRRDIVDILTLGLEKGGSTDRNYVDAEGKRGSYLSFAKVFRREDEPCERCDTEIIKIRVAGRGTHVCPSCQKR